MHRMRGMIAVCALAGLTGCPDQAREPVPASASTEEAAPVPEEATPSPSVECTWETPLEPGIPGSPGNLIPSEINPNGASELSVLMRKMVADLREVRQAILNNSPPATYPDDHGRMRCTWPTDSDVRNAMFDGMAKNYLASYERLVTAQDSHARHFESVLDGCIGCHSNTCQGPIPMIESLRLPVAGN